MEKTNIVIVFVTIFGRKLSLFISSRYLRTLRDEKMLHKKIKI